MKSTHKAKKHFGQNFLTDRRTQEKIIQACGLKSTDTVLEIGPGQGAITRFIAPNVEKLICIEKDRDLITALNDEFADSNVQIIQEDFLKWDMSTLPQGVKVIGNIPYNISTPIIEKLIKLRDTVSSAFLTVQLEFGKRLAAKPGNKDYGSLSCFIQYNAQVKLLFNIKNTCFNPAPKVDSCFVHLDFSQKPHFDVKDEALLFRLIRTVFTQRRKTFINGAAPLIEKERMGAILEKLQIPSQIRPEELDLKQFVQISNFLV